MRIGVDARPLSYQLTGIGFYLKYLLDAIQDLDNNATYYLISNRPIQFDLRNKNWFKSEGNIKRKLLSTLWMQTWGAAVISTLNLDLFWGPRHHLPLWLSPKTKTVLTVHDIVHRRYPQSMALPNLMMERLLLSLSIRRSDAIIADSNSTSFDLQRYYGADARCIRTIYPGTPPLKAVAAQHVKPAGGLPCKYFLFVGTLDPRKNFFRIFQAFERIEPEKNNLHLVIVGGEGWKNKDFHQMITRHPLRSSIHLTGYVPRDQLALYYQNSLCLLFPSMYEGFGFPILEAMSLGTPVITANTASMPEVAQEAALLVDPFDVNALAAAMIRIMEDESLRDQLKIKGIKRAKKFSWAECAEKTLAVFESVLSR